MKKWFSGKKDLGILFFHPKMSYEHIGSRGGVWKCKTKKKKSGVFFAEYMAKSGFFFAEYNSYEESTAKKKPDFQSPLQKKPRF